MDSATTQSKNKTIIYFMPGMAANSLIFENLTFNKDSFECYYLEWLEPHKNESLQAYCKRLVQNIHHKNPVLVGVSFGGIIVQEIAKLIQTQQVVIISSVKDPSEFPWRMKFARTSKIYHLFPTRYINLIERVSKKIVSSKKIIHRIDLYQKYLTVRSNNYLDWAFKNVLEWKNEDPIRNILHIHGSKDHIFPANKIQDAIVLKNATHLLIMLQAKWINENLPKLLNKNKSHENSLD